MSKSLCHLLILVHDQDLVRLTLFAKIKILRKFPDLQYKFELEPPRVISNNVDFWQV